MLEWLYQLDKELFLSINSFGYPHFNTFMLWMSNKYIWFPLYAYLIFRLYQHEGLSFYQPLLALIVLVVITDQVTSGLMKPFFERYRPCHHPQIQELMTGLSKCGGLYGFASSHAANTFGLASFFYFYKNGKTGMFLLLWAFVVSYSRVYLGAHFPSDVLAGAVIGVCAAYLIYGALHRIQRRIRI